MNRSIAIWPAALIAATLAFIAACVSADPAAAQSTCPKVFNSSGLPTQAQCVMTVDTSGNYVAPGGGGSGGAVYGPTASGSPPDNPPVLVGGSDGTNVRTIRTFTDGSVAIGTADGAARLTVMNGTASTTSQLGLLTRSQLQIFDGTANQVMRDATTANATTGTGLAGAGILGKYNATLPTYTDGQYGNVQISSKGGMRVINGLQALGGTDGRNNASIGYMLAEGDHSTSLSLAVSGWGFNGTGWDRLRTIQGTDGTGLGVQAVANNPNSAAGSGAMFTAGAAVASSLVAKASAGNLYAMNVTAGASALYVMVFDATSAPADGAVTPKWCLPLAANAGLDKVFNPPLRGATGLTIVASTTGCYTKTASATAFITAQAQ